MLRSFIWAGICSKAEENNSGAFFVPYECLFDLFWQWAWELKGAPPSLSVFRRHSRNFLGLARVCGCRVVQKLPNFFTSPSVVVSVVNGKKSQGVWAILGRHSLIHFNEVQIIISLISWMTQSNHLENIDLHWNFTCWSVMVAQLQYKI